MRVLIHNLHDDASGGGGYYCSQIIKACSEVCETFITTPRLEERFENNPELMCEVQEYSGQDVDAFIDINHFCSVIKKGVRNIKICYFPDQDHDVSGYDDIVTLSEYSQKWVKEYWGRDSLICKPYSKDLKPGGKRKNTIATTGNIFYEDDGHCKNQHTLIEAFKKLPGDWELNIIGNSLSASYYESLKQRAEGLNVNILVSISDEEKERILAESEFYWHANGYMRTKPGQTEHFGIGAEEAIKSGCLTYVVPAGGIQDFCTTWDSVEDLVEKTISRCPNKSVPDYQTPEKMKEFFEQLIKD